MKTRLYKNSPPYFIVLASSVKTKEVEVIEFIVDVAFYEVAGIDPLSAKHDGVSLTFGAQDNWKLNW